jgi:alkanesulfonate monooxygenase SsuD/methylene tetrahydromethanopterin reductase-like flavin-dependent oxidoreductase (luciferase family)
LLGHLAAVTSKARIGSLALLPALRDPVLLAEELTTLGLLAKGRFAVGLASGCAFAPLLALHGLSAAAARERLRELMMLWQPTAVSTPVGAASSDGLLARRAGSQLDALSPPLAPVQAWVAADDEQTRTQAGRCGWGLIAAATHTRERVQRALATAAEAAGGTAPPLTLARFACSADSHAQAEEIARPYFESLARRAREHGWGQDCRLSIAQDVEALLAESLVGSHAEVAEAFKALADTHGASRIAIVPTSGQFDTHKHLLAAFVDEVRPLLDE